MHTSRRWDPAHGTDRRLGSAKAQWVDRVLARADWLAEPDRALIDTALRQGRPATEIARLSRAKPETVRRRIRRLVAVLLDPRVTFLLAHHHAWPAQRTALARALYIERLSTTAAADRLGLTYHTARRQREALDAMYHAWLLRQIGAPDTAVHAAN